MSIRRGKTRRAMTAVAITTGLVLAAAGCSGGEDGGSDPEKSSVAGDEGGDDAQDDAAPDGSTVLAEVKGGDGLTLTFNSATRDDGGFVTVTGKLTYSGGGTWISPGWSGDEEELAAMNKTSLAGAKLTDRSGKKRYYILRDTEGRCLCTQFPRGIRSGETETWYAQFPAPPEKNNEVDFQIADMPPATLTISGR